MNNLTIAAYSHVTALLPADKGRPKVNPTSPPGADKFEKIINWVAWIAFGMGLIGVIIVGIMMMVGANRGSGDDVMKKLGFVLGGCIIAASAGGIVGAFM